MADDKKNKKKISKDAAENDMAEEKMEAQEESQDTEAAEIEDMVKKLEEENKSYLELCQRTRAEFENYKKRNSTLRKDSVDEGVREAVSAMLPVIDNLERAIGAAEDHEHTKSIKEGVEMIFAQLLGALEGLGLEEIKAEGEAFDPNLHHAVMQGEADNDYPEDTVMEVLQKGYFLRGKIIRHSMVKVAK